MLRSTIIFLFFLCNLASSEPVSTIIRRHETSGSDVAPGEDHFTGSAWIDTLHQDNETTMSNVLFLPSARTNWHTHVGGQMLRVVAGSGWICDKDGEPRPLVEGDIAWCPPGITHWHGADNGSYMVHEAFAYGPTEWLGAVSDEEYGQA